MKPAIAIFLLAFLLSITFTSKVWGQEKNGKKAIELLLANGQPKIAETALKNHLDYLKTSGQKDSIAYYIELRGYVYEALHLREIAIKKTEQFFDDFQNSISDPYLKKEALQELASFYDTVGLITKSFEMTEKALELALKVEDKKKQGLEIIYYNLGLRAKNTGNILLSKQYHLKALRLLEKKPSHTTESLFNSYNSLGGVMYFQAKLDSALYYFEHAVEALKKAEYDPLNTYYRTAMVQANMAVIEQAMGNPQKAIDISKKVIENYSCYLEITTDASRKLRVVRFLGMSIDNLGTFYNGIGMFKKADDLIAHSYYFKKKHLPENDWDLIISKILMSEAKMSLREFHAAETLLLEALEMMELNGQEQLYWKCSALQTLAENYRELGNPVLAEKYYNLGEPLRIEVFGSDYNNDFMDVSNQMAHFFAENNNGEKALSIANDTYQYALKTQSENSLLLIKQILAMGNVNYILKNYEKSLEFGEMALEKFEKQNAQNPLDSIFTAFRKPGAMLLKIKSLYALTPEKPEAFLKEMSSKVNEALDILEKRKSILTDTESLQALLGENEDLISFAKKIQVNLYEKTGDPIYLKNALAFHESALYSRIRSRLSLNATRFSGVPENVQKREEALKKTLNSAITENEEVTISTFFKAENEWADFLKQLKEDYPAYYKMRYETLTEDIDITKLPFEKGVTVIRYFYIDEQLYAAILKGTDSHLIALDGANISEKINGINIEIDLKNESKSLYELYKKLWKPLATHIKTNKIVIIPDADLFNISFESLVTKPVNSYKALVENSLLQQYTFSYNYSLLVGNQTNNHEALESMTAFAPVFSSDLKESYREQLTDSIAGDEAYLSLLSQPFTQDLTGELKKEFGARVFLKEDATKQNFLENAQSNSILHIGTHAVSDNLRPELSQLVFAKDNANFEEGNIVYAHEIYGAHLPSELTVLTACETGKPGFQPGEGMISLAHAFNYAGSESLMTSLWKIDEASSAVIVKSFYEYLNEDFPKDEALRKAKLDYLQTAEGRTLAPQYWAGLVIMGDVRPIPMETNKRLWWAFGGGLIGLAAIGFLIYRGKK